MAFAFPKNTTRSFRFDSWLLGVGFGLVVIAAMLANYLVKSYEDRFYPGISINGVDVSGMSMGDALGVVPTTPLSSDTVVTLAVDDIQIASTAAELGLHQDREGALRQAFSIGKTGSWWQRVWLLVSLPFSPRQLTPDPQFDEFKTLEMVTFLAKQVNTPGEEPHASLRVSGAPSTLTIHPGIIGRELQTATAWEQLKAQAGKDSATLLVSVASTSSTLSPDQVEAAKTRATALVGKELKFMADTLPLILNDQTLVSYLAFPTEYRTKEIETTVTTWADRIRRPAQDAEFTYDPTTLKVTSFKPHRDGLVLDQLHTHEQVAKLLKELETQLATPPSDPTQQPPAQLTAELMLHRTSPEKPLTSTNDLGITERIGFGDSQYHHSIPNRIHNVSLTTERITNTIVPPGAEFSFNKALGEVSGATGFRTAYVISGGRTVLGDGGGVCQVSSTLFRALLDAGLPITKRKPHSYRVSYYEENSQPGFDATVYAGDVDLRFINDTGHHVLIHGEADPDNVYLKVELYGTSDGRTTEITDYQKWDFRGPPPAQYFPDPTLKPGQLRQIDWAASGLKTKFTHIVRDKNGTIISQKEYSSNYQPWSAKYMRGI